MKTFLKWLVLAPVALLLILFAVTNREPVRVVLDPLPGDMALIDITAPLFIILFLAAGLGVIAGGIAGWFVQARQRQAIRTARADVERLQREADSLRQQLSPRLLGSGERPRDAA